MKNVNIRCQFLLSGKYSMKSPVAKIGHNEVAYDLNRLGPDSLWKNNKGKQYSASLGRLPNMTPKSADDCRME